MVTGLITLPLRFGVRASMSALRAAEDATERTLRAVGQLGTLVLPGRSNDSEPRVTAHALPSRVTAPEPGATPHPPPGAPEPEPRATAHPAHGGGPDAERHRTPGGPVTVARPEPAPPPRAVDEQPDAAEPISEPEPAPHVSEEPELVSELAEPGAEEGAGASVTVSEPWSGYAQMRAQDVIDKLPDATPAELAAIELYERANRGRETVLAAAEHELKTKSGRGSVN